MCVSCTTTSMYLNGELLRFSLCWNEQGAHDESAPGLTELHEWREKGTPPNRKTIWAPLSLLVLVISDLRAGNCACLHFCLLVGGREHFFYLVTRTSTTSGLRRQSGPGSPAQIPSPLPPPHASPVLAAPLQRQQERHPPTGRTKNEKAGFFFGPLSTRTHSERGENNTACCWGMGGRSLACGSIHRREALWRRPAMRKNRERHAAHGVGETSPKPGGREYSCRALGFPTQASHRLCRSSAVHPALTLTSPFLPDVLKQ